MEMKELMLYSAQSVKTFLGYLDPDETVLVKLRIVNDQKVYEITSNANAINAYCDDFIPEAD